MQVRSTASTWATPLQGVPASGNQPANSRLQIAGLPSGKTDADRLHNQTLETTAVVRHNYPATIYIALGGPHGFMAVFSAQSNMLGGAGTHYPKTLMYSAEVVSLAENDNFGNADRNTATKQGYLNEYYDGVKTRAPLTFKRIQTPDWFTYLGSFHYWITFIEISSPVCLGWTLPASGTAELARNGYNVVMADGTVSALSKDCKPAPPTPPPVPPPGPSPGPPGPPHQLSLRYAEIAGAGAAALLLVSFATSRYQRGLRFFAILLAATAAALGLAASLPPPKTNS